MKEIMGMMVFGHAMYAKLMLLVKYIHSIAKIVDMMSVQDAFLNIFKLEKKILVAKYFKVLSNDKQHLQRVNSQ